MGKHKKHLKSEKAKVKLKGNKLPKGQNVTKTDFRVKKIVIRDQVSEINLLGDVKRKHNLKETLNKLKHHNSSFRMDALRALKEQITIGLDSINLSLGMLVQGLSAISLDMDKDIRRESYKIISILFSNTNEICLEPYFEIILSYLSCAMTHIQQPIQDDSLLMLDVLLKFQPKLTAVYSDKIFTNFLDMISKVTNSQNRSLIISMGNKLSTVKWRSKILQRMKELLKTIVDVTLIDNDSINARGSKNDVKKHSFISTQRMHFSAYRPHYCMLPSSTVNTVVSKLLCKSISEKGTTKVLNDDEKLKHYIVHLMPLLFQSWLEVALSDKQQGILTTDSAFTLKQVIEICEFLWKLTEIQCKKTNNDALIVWFRTNYYHEFRINMFSRFPYQQIEGVKDFKKKFNSQTTEKDVLNSGGQFCLFQNFSIIYFYCALASVKIKYDQDGVHKVLDFLISALPKLRHLSTDEVICAEKALKMILITNSQHFMKADSNKSLILFKSILNLLNTDYSSSKELKNKILVIISNIILDDVLYKMYGPNEFENWILMLPKMVLRKSQITQNIILTLSKLAKQKNETFLTALKSNIDFVIDNISHVQVTGCNDLLEGRKLIMNLYFWIEDWSKVQRENICKKIQENVKDNDELCKYFQFIILKENLS